MPTVKKPERKYKIVDVVREPERLAVKIDFIQEGKTVCQVNYAYPLTHTSEQIEELAAKACKVYFEDVDRSILDAARSKRDKAAEETKDQLIGKEQSI